MTELLWIRSHVELLLAEEWGVCRVKADDDGDWFFRAGTAAGWVSVIDTAPIMVRVFAHAATGLKPSLKLFTELNEIERRALSAAVVLEHGTVVVSQTISPVGLTAPVLQQALVSVGGVAEDIGLLLAGMYGGSTPFPAEAAPAHEDTPRFPTE
jgi:hypothetical protein